MPSSPSLLGGGSVYDDDLGQIASRNRPDNIFLGKTAPAWSARMETALSFDSAWYHKHLFCDYVMIMILLRSLNRYLYLANNVRVLKLRVHRRCLSSVETKSLNLYHIIASLENRRPPPR